MSRSAVDATRFTATSPHAYAKPTPINRASSNTPRSTPTARSNPNARHPPPPIEPQKGTQPPRESPAEKVARLREARLRERAAQITTWDRVVVRGRVWADKAHKFSVYSIVGFSIITALITGISLTDMILHNRRKRTAFYNEQHALYSQRLIEAIETEKSGLPLDEDQTLILNRERARVQAEEAKKERTWRKRIRGVFVGGLKRDDDDDVVEEGRVAEGGASAVPSEGDILQKIGVQQTTILERAALADKEGGRVETAGLAGGRDEGRGDGSGVLQAVRDKRKEGERAMEAAGVRGGPLDRTAEGAVRDVAGKMQAAEEKVGSRGGWSWWGWK